MIKLVNGLFAITAPASGAPSTDFCIMPLKANCSADSAEMALAMEKDSVWRGSQESGTFTLP